MPSELEEQVRQIHDECEQAVEDHQWEAALSGFTQLLPLLDTAQNWVDLARIHLRMGQLSEELSQNERACRHYTTAKRLAKTIDDRRLLAAALHRLAHLKRTGAARQARALFQECLDLQIDDPEADALSLAMIGQIDFTGGDRMSGLDTMLQALNKMPGDSHDRTHLLEHVAHFGGKIPLEDFRRLVHLRIGNPELVDKLLENL